MGDLAAILPTYYGLTGRASKERGNYICRMKNGYGKIIKTNESPQGINRRYVLLEQLTKSGFEHADKIFLSTHGLPYVNLGRETYVMSRHIKGRDMDFNNTSDVMLALTSLAKFHKIAQGLQFEAALSPPSAPSLLSSWEKESASLKHAFKQVNKNSRLSDFDMLFIKNAKHYTEQAENAAVALKNTDYTTLQTSAIASKCICHNGLKEENLPIFNDACYITRITEATFDLQMTDLANFIRRYAGRSDKALSIADLMQIYDNINPLPASALDIIHAQLIYPWQFVKIIKQYYSKKRGWTPIALMSRINNVLEEQPAFDEYVGCN